MPRERISHGSLTTWAVDGTDKELVKSWDGADWKGASTLPDGVVLREGISLDVHWNRDGEYVQVGLDAPRDWWERFIASFQGSPDVRTFAIFCESLSRKELNDMIRTLKRARDAAYGKDE